MTDGLTSDTSQHVVVQSNVDSSQPEGVQVKTRKRKRRLRSDADHGENQNPTDSTVKVKLKKRKERHVPDNGGSDSRKQKHSDVNDGNEPAIASEANHHVQVSDAQIDPELLLPNSNPSTSVFLSAVLAAASATSASQHIPPYQPIAYAHDPPMPYSSVQHPCDAQQIPPHLPGQPFPISLATPLSEVSNDDILRALQDLDMSKIASVLKTLTDAASAANISLAPQPHFMDQHLPTVQQMPVPSTHHHLASSSTFTGQPSIPTNNQRRLDMSLPVPHHINPDHAQLLSTKWLNASKLAELVETEGLVYKKGKFSAIEEHQLKEAISNYCTTKQINDEQLNDIIFAKAGKSGDSAFWSEITAAVPLRPIIAVYHHVRREFHPLKQQGKWMPSEDALLKQAVADLGQQWEKVSERVGRMSSDCRDRYRNHISHREVRVSGQWTPEEEEILIRIVTEMTVDRGGNLDDDVFWGKVSERMENKRGRQQCRIKWTDSLSKTVKNKGQKPRWSQHDAYILVHKVEALPVRDDTEIDWKSLQDPSWNLWSAHSLQRRWLAMKRSIKGYEDMTHQEIVDILRVKKAQVPAPPTTPSRKRRVVSSADVIETEQHATGSSVAAQLE